MIQTIRVQTIKGKDTVGDGVLSEIRHTLSLQTITKVQSAKVYRLEGVSGRDAKVLSEKLFCEEINQAYTLNKPILTNVHLGGESNCDRSCV